LVKLYFNGTSTAVANVTVGSDGNWTVTNLPIEWRVLYNLTATQEDSAGVSDLALGGELQTCTVEKELDGSKLPFRAFKHIAGQSTSSIELIDVQVDSQGNVYTCGYTYYSAQFGNVGSGGAIAIFRSRS
jgi:hypothetical protein